MRTLHSRTCFAFLCNAIAVFAFSVCLPVSAQQNAASAPLTPLDEPAKLEQRREPQRQSREPRQNAASEGRPALETVIPEITVPAGQKLEGLVDFLSDRTGANFVIDETLQSVKLPALKLRNVTILSVLEAIRMTSKQGLVISYSEHRGPGALVVTISPTPSRRNEVTKPTKICRVFRLVLDGPSWVISVADDKTKKLLAERVEHISEAARTACRALAAANGKTKADSDYPQLEVHAPTQLLMVIGEEADVDLVGQIISGVGGVPMTGAKPELPKVR